MLTEFLACREKRGVGGGTQTFIGNALGWKHPSHYPSGAGGGGGWVSLKGWLKYLNLFHLCWRKTVSTEIIKFFFRVSLTHSRKIFSEFTLEFINILRGNYFKRQNTQHLNAPNLIVRDGDKDFVRYIFRIIRFTNNCLLIRQPVCHKQVYYNCIFDGRSTIWWLWGVSLAPLGVVLFLEVLVRILWAISFGIFSSTPLFLFVLFLSKLFLLFSLGR